MREREIAGRLETVFLGIKDLLSVERAEAKRERVDWREEWTRVIISKGLSGSIFVLVILIWDWTACLNQDDGERISSQTTHTPTWRQTFQWGFSYLF